MIYYDQYFRPINLHQIVEQHRHQSVQQMPEPVTPEGAWTLAPPATKAQPINSNAEQVAGRESPEGILFRDLSAAVNIQEIGNKEARLGDTLYFFNQETGELYKKYVDFLSGHMIVESAKFTRNAVAVPTLTVDDLHKQILALTAEVEELKNVNSKNDSKSSVGLVQQKHKASVQSGNPKDGGS